MAEAALVRRSPPADRGLLVRERRHLVALRAVRLRVRAGERPAGHRLVIEARDLERLRRVALVALVDRLREPELAEVLVVVAAAADARDAAVARAVPGLAILRRRVMAALAAASWRARR